MNEHKKAVAKTCLDGAENNTMTFPQIVGALTWRKDLESYMIDFRRGNATYYLPDGRKRRAAHANIIDGPVALAFDATIIQPPSRGAPAH